MKLTLAEPKYLKESIAIISDLVNEARFKVTKDSMELVAMDPANVAMVIFKLLSSTFTEYDVKKDVEIAINLSNFKQIMRSAKPNDMLTLELDPKNKLIIQLKGDSVRTFNLPIIELDEKEQKIPDLKFPVTINISSSILNEAIEDVDVVSESVTFSAEPKKFTIHAEGDLSQANIEMKEGDKIKRLVPVQPRSSRSAKAIIRSAAQKWKTTKKRPMPGKKAKRQAKTQKSKTKSGIGKQKTKSRLKPRTK